MDTSRQHTVLQIQFQKKRSILLSIQQLKLLGVAIVILTIFIAFSKRTSSTYVFISFLSLLLVQIFATTEYVKLAKNSRRTKLLLLGNYFQQKAVPLSWKIPAGVAVKDTYFLLVLFFDVSWLAHAYLYPSPANSLQQFLDQLTIGPVTGSGFLWFTVFLWAFYTYLLLYGVLYSGEVHYADERRYIVPGSKEVSNEPVEIWIKVRTFENDTLYLQGHRFANTGKQSLILFPGFFQNGYVYDLSKQVSLARFLWENNFDVFIIHPRGTAQSEGRWKGTSIDDFACDDIPAVIDYVFNTTGIKPVFVGHSQGGIAAIISMMGPVKQPDATVILSDKEKDLRQGNLKALVTIGSFLDFSFNKRSWLPSFVKKGIRVNFLGLKIKIASTQSLLKILRRSRYVGTPFSFQLRIQLLQSRLLRFCLFPISLMLNFLALRKLWEFLYHIPNVGRSMRIKLFYKTMDGTYSSILQQFASAVLHKEMMSLDTRVNYSANYQRLTLPVSIVAMELDTLADDVMMKNRMFANISSGQKFFTVWSGMGHEDHFTDKRFFSQVLACIQKVC